MGSTGRQAALAAPKQGASRKHTMLSEGLKGRDSLKLSFNRSISEPGHSVPMISMLSPPSVAPSLHPPKRCKIDRSKVGYLTPNAGVEPRDPSLIPPLDL